MADITLSYKGNTIKEISASGTTTLNTAGKYCEGNITLAYTQPSGGDIVIGYKRTSRFRLYNSPNGMTLNLDAVPQLIIGYTCPTSSRGSSLEQTSQPIAFVIDRTSTSLINAQGGPYLSTSSGSFTLLGKEYPTTDTKIKYTLVETETGAQLTILPQNLDEYTWMAFDVWAIGANITS